MSVILQPHTVSNYSLLKKADSAFSSPTKRNCLKHLAILLLAGQTTASNSTSQNSLKSCALTAVITSGHGFVNFDCGKTYETLGFYPKNLIDKPQMQKKAKLVLIPISSFSYDFLPLTPHPLIYNSMVVMNIFLTISSPITGQIKDDKEDLDFCIFKTYNCLMARITVPEEIAMQAYNEAKSLQKAALEYSNNLSAKPLLKEITYIFSKNNCIDFMSHIMDISGEDWRNQMKYNQPVMFFEKIFAIAWNYFHWINR
ncbi:MAG: hypothetical protein H0X29_11520 [Parachlamydiaceae bacterium]|nr:hypothetical protein [Parachlamydiaceae bacterium]